MFGWALSVEEAFYPLVHDETFNAQETRQEHDLLKLRRSHPPSRARDMPDQAPIAECARCDHDCIECGDISKWSVGAINAAIERVGMSRD